MSITPNFCCSRGGAVLQTVLAVLLCQSLAWSAVFHVDPMGDDSGAGSEAAPWRTIQKGVSGAQPGDRVIVRAGQYDERLTTVRGGASATARVSFTAEGRVTMRGWVINHPYVTVEGFDITGHTGSGRRDAYVRVGGNGDEARVLNCTIRDGIGIRRDDMIFTAPNQISSATGGFLAAGFRPGLNIFLARGLNVNLLNSAAYVITTATDTVLTVTGPAILDDGPKPAYITGSEHYGLSVEDGAQDGIFRGNLFSNLTYRYCSMSGVRNLFQDNILERNNGWDLIFFFGSDHVFTGNLFRDVNTLGIYSPSVDIFDNFAVKYERITFTRNFVQDLIGVISAQKRNDSNSGPLTVSENVFVDCGFFSGRFPNTTFESNTFLRVARQSNVSVQRESHPLIFETADYATGAVIRNNVFFDCGEPAGQITSDQVGWYRFVGPTATVVTEGNFVAGAAPDFGAKTGFAEGNPLLNGGDPGFLDPANPLGPDGLPFTDDDGLRLRADSKLRGAGIGGVNVGAYAEAPVMVGPTLAFAGIEAGVGWLEVGTEPGDFYQVERSDELGDGAWVALGSRLLGTGGVMRVLDPEAGTVARRFYRVRLLPE